MSEVPTPRLSVALYEPEIPPNTGNIARLCAANYVPLHIVGRAAFDMDDRAVRRAGLDYWPEVRLTQHPSFAAFEESAPHTRLLLFSTKVDRSYTDWVYQPGDCLMFGPETRGLPADLLQAHAPHCLTIPMLNPAIRSLNLGSSVAIVLYEALRQMRKGSA